MTALRRDSLLLLLLLVLLLLVLLLLVLLLLVLLLHVHARAESGPGNAMHALACDWAKDYGPHRAEVLCAEARYPDDKDIGVSVSVSASVCV